MPKKLSVPKELLGTMSDADLARQLGVSRQVVYNHRTKAGIPPWDALLELAAFIRSVGPGWTWAQVAAKFNYPSSISARRAFQSMGTRRRVRVPGQDLPVTPRKGVGAAAYQMRLRGKRWREIDAALGVANSCSSAKLWARRNDQPWPPVPHDMG